jgi:hypothetical protein
MQRVTEYITLFGFMFNDDHYYSDDDDDDEWLMMFLGNWRNNEE